MCANRQTNRWAQKFTVILTNHKSHFGGKRWYLIVQLYHVLSPKPCVILRHWGYRGFPPLERARQSAPRERQRDQGIARIGLRRPQREAAGQGLGASRTPWSSLRQPREPLRGDKRAHPGLGGAAALGGARGRIGSSGERGVGAELLKWKTPPNLPKPSERYRNAQTLVFVSRSQLCSSRKAAARPVRRRRG